MRLSVKHLPSTFWLLFLLQLYQPQIYILMLSCVFSLDNHLLHFSDVLGQNPSFQLSFLVTPGCTDHAFLPHLLITYVNDFYYIILHWFVYCLAILCWLSVFHIFPSRLLYHGKHRLSLTFIFSQTSAKVF